MPPWPVANMRRPAEAAWRSRVMQVRRSERCRPRSMTSQMLGCEGPSRPADLDDSAAASVQRDDVHRTIRSGGAIRSGGRLDLRLINSQPENGASAPALEACQSCPPAVTARCTVRLLDGASLRPNSRGTLVWLTRRRRKHPRRQPHGASLGLLENVDGELGCRIEYCKIRNRRRSTRSRNAVSRPDQGRFCMVVRYLESHSSLGINRGGRQSC